jgi:hypothetical protein
MLAIADFLQAVRLKQELRGSSPAPAPASKKNYTPTDVGHRKVEDIACPECGDEMRKRHSDWGYFYGCIDHPTCRGKRSLRSAQKPRRPGMTRKKPGKPAASEPKCGECLWNAQDVVALVDGICPKCGADYRDTLAFKAERSLRSVPKGGQKP